MAQDFEIISNIGDPAVQRVSDLVKPGKAVSKMVLIEDAEPVVQAIAAGVKFVEVYGDARQDIPQSVVDACAAAGVPIRKLDTSVVKQVFKNDRLARLFGVAKVPPAQHISDLIDKDGPIVILDGVKIVGNMGAIVRSCLALGASGLVLVDSDLTSVADRRLVRSSRGYVFTLPTILSSRTGIMDFLESKKIRTALFDSHGAKSLNTLAGTKERIALVFGSEKFGPSEDFRRISKDVVAIDMNEEAESLNVSVSVGIALHVVGSSDLRPF